MPKPMDARHRFNLSALDAFRVTVGPAVFSRSECYVFAELSNRAAGIYQEIWKSTAKKFIFVTVVSEDDDWSSMGVLKGWYEAHLISEADAEKWREGWSVIGEQPLPPGGPWA